MELGADDYLTKPFTPEEPLGAVKARLAKHAVILQDIDRQTKELDLLRQVDQELSSRLSPERVIMMMMDWALRQTNADNTIMGVIVPETETFRYRIVITTGLRANTYIEKSTATETHYL